MNTQTHFNIDDNIFSVTLVRSNKRRTCETCEGGILVVEDSHDCNIILSAVLIRGKLFPCPACEGKGYHATVEQSYGVLSGNVTKIRITHEKMRSPVVLYQLGLCGQNEFPEENCFATQAEAQARADISNNYMRQK